MTKLSEVKARIAAAGETLKDIEFLLDLVSIADQAFKLLYIEPNSKVGMLVNAFREKVKS